MLEIKLGVKLGVGSKTGSKNLVLAFLKCTDGSVLAFLNRTDGSILEQASVDNIHNTADPLVYGVFGKKVIHNPVGGQTP